MGRVIFIILLYFVSNIFYAQTIREPIEGYKFNIDYANSLMLKADFFFTSENYGEAIRIEEERLAILDSIMGRDCIEYAYSLGRLSKYVANLGDYSKAIEYFNCSAKIIKKISSANNIFNNCSQTRLFRSALNELANFYFKLGNYNEALNYYELIISSFENDRKDSEYFGYLHNIANCYYMSYSYQDAIRIYSYVLQKQEIISGKNSPHYLSTLEDLAMCHAGLFQYQDAINLQSECVKMNKEIFGNHSSKYASSLVKLGYLYRCIGENEQAKKTQDEAVQLLKQENKFSSDYIFALLNHYWNYVFDQPQVALQLAEEADRVLESISKIPTHLNIDCLYKLSYANLYLGNYDSAQQIYEERFESSKIKNYLENDSIEYARYLHSKSLFYSHIKKYEDALSTESQTLDIMEKLHLTNTHLYQLSLGNLFGCYINLNDTANIIRVLKRSMEIEHPRIYNNIYSMTSKNRESYWSKNITNYKDILPLLALATHDSTLLCNAYNYSALFAKGILLREDTKLSKTIKQSQDSCLIDKYYKLQKCKTDFNDFSYNENRDSLLLIIIQLENEIKQALVSRKQDSLNSITWEDVQHHLQSDDIAVEFISFNLENGDEGYAALLLKKDYETPLIIPLFNNNELDSLIRLGTTSSRHLYKYIWEPIEEHIGLSTNIYFSPSGRLYNLAIENLPDKNGTYLCDKYNVYRLSSTEEILSSTPLKKRNMAVLFGGLDFNSYIDKSEQQITDKNPKESILLVNRKFRNSLTQRGGFEPLHNSLLEIHEISQLLQSNDIKCEIYEGKMGSEESLKKLSEDKTNILHLATHGMYIADKEVLYSNLFKISPMEDEMNNIPLEDVSLTRSFLVLSGGNMLPTGHKIPKGLEDGILTAQEISWMNFENLDLVVMSACQSGLGDISNDGVLGLQRGFKKAGAKTIVMSLDKVDDEATRILMVEFYRNLMSGKTKLQSLKDAQKHLREVDNGKYDHPKYWASFILLDGLN